MGYEPDRKNTRLIPSPGSPKTGSGGATEPPIQWILEFFPGRKANSSYTTCFHANQTVGTSTFSSCFWSITISTGHSSLESVFALVYSSHFHFIPSSSAYIVTVKKNHSENMTFMLCLMLHEVPGVILHSSRDCCNALVCMLQ